MIYKNDDGTCGYCENKKELKEYIVTFKISDGDNTYYEYLHFRNKSEKGLKEKAEEMVK